MEIFWLILFGVLGGILGGMGMGGGTFLIPLLTIFLRFNQRLAQGYNLISFVLMSVVAIVIHSKNKLIEKKAILPVLIPAVLFSILGSFLANFIDAKVLRKLFGLFLITLSIIEFINFFKEKGQENKK